MSEYDDETISKLLRLKRHEQPPPEYFDKFLKDFHHRQRAEMLRRSAWRIMLDRIDALLSQFTFSELAYAGASTAVLLVAGAMTLNMVQHPGLAVTGTRRSEATALATVSNSVASSALPVQVVSATATYPGAQQFSLSPQIQLPDAMLQQGQRSVQGASRSHPRYVLDSRPVSYEPPFSF